MKLLFISNSKHHLYPARDASTRYRCLHHIEGFEELGISADLCTQRHFGIRLTERYDIYIFHRPKYTYYLDSLLNLMARRGKLVIADYDDLLFTPELAHESPIFRNGNASLKIAKKLHNNYAHAMSLFDHFTVSTAPLADEIHNKNPNATIEIIHNGFSKLWIEQAELSEAPTDRQVIGYFPGTSSHDKDFETVADDISKHLEKPNRNLKIVGPLKLSEGQFPPQKVARLSHFPYDQLPRLISSCNVTIAPLELTNFNYCKSGLKFIESSVFSVPVVATPIPDIVRFRPSGILLFENGSELRMALDSLDEKCFYQDHVANIHSHVKTYCSAIEQTKRLLSYLLSLKPFDNLNEKPSNISN